MERIHQVPDHRFKSRKKFRPSVRPELTQANIGKLLDTEHAVEGVVQFAYSRTEWFVAGYLTGCDGDLHPFLERKVEECVELSDGTLQNVIGNAMIRDVKDAGGGTRSDEPLDHERARLCVDLSHRTAQDRQIDDRNPDCVRQDASHGHPGGESLSIRGAAAAGTHGTRHSLRRGASRSA